jgi:hypothetical protein
MAEAVDDSRDPVKVKAGRIGARKRWDGHTPRVVRLDALLPEERRVVEALLELKRSRERAPTA